MEHSVLLTGFQNSIRRTSNYLSYSLGLLEVKQSLANLCFIFDLQSPHHNTQKLRVELPSPKPDCVLDNFIPPAETLILPLDKKETWISLEGKLSCILTLLVTPTICVKTLVT